MGDEAQINQIILNLCTNAAHAMEAEGGKMTIGIDAITLDDGKSRERLKSSAWKIRQTQCQ